VSSSYSRHVSMHFEKSVLSRSNTSIIWSSHINGRMKANIVSGFRTSKIRRGKRFHITEHEESNFFSYFVGPHRIGEATSPSVGCEWLVFMAPIMLVTVGSEDRYNC